MTNLANKMARIESKLANIDFKLGTNAPCYLTFSLPGSEVAVNEDGVEIPSQVLLTVKAYLYQKSRKIDWENTEQAFINPSTAYLEGFLVEPTHLPAQCRPMTQGDFFIDNPDYPMGGRFLLLPSIPDREGFIAHSIKLYANLGAGAPSPLTLPIIGVPYYAPTVGQSVLLVGDNSALSGN